MVAFFAKIALIIRSLRMDSFFSLRMTYHHPEEKRFSLETPDLTDFDLVTIGDEVMLYFDRMGRLN